MPGSSAWPTMTSPRIADIQTLYSDAEESVKRYERIGLDNLVPAINELRYAGQHLIAAETANGEDERDKHLFRAERHCERARYDAKESTIVALLERIATIRSLGVTDGELAEVLPDWEQILRKACHAQSFLVRAGNVKNAPAEELDKAIFELLDASEQLHRCEPAIMGLRQKRLEAIDAERQAEENRRVHAQEEAMREERIKDDRRYANSMLLAWIGLVVGALGLAATIFGTVIALKK